MVFDKHFFKKQAALKPHRQCWIKQGYFFHNNAAPTNKQQYFWKQNSRLK